MNLKKQLQEKDGIQYTPTREDVDHWFKLINRCVFLGELTPFSKIVIKRMHGVWGAVVYDDEIKNCQLELHLGTKFNDKHHFINILAHEMVHKWQLEINIDTGNHNKHFYSWRETFKEHGLTLTRAS